LKEGNKNNVVGCNYFDITKAFDTVNHNIHYIQLLYKLKKFIDFFDLRFKIYCFFGQDFYLLINFHFSFANQSFGTGWPMQ